MTTRNATTASPQRCRDLHELMLKSAINGGHELLANAASMFRRYAEELDRYVARYDECDSDPTLKQEAVLSWAINYLAHVYGNLRMDLMVTKAAEIAEQRQQLIHAESEVESETET